LSPVGCYNSPLGPLTPPVRVPAPQVFSLLTSNPRFACHSHNPPLFMHLYPCLSQRFHRPLNISTHHARCGPGGPPGPFLSPPPSPSFFGLSYLGIFSYAFGLGRRFRRLFPSPRPLWEWLCSPSQSCPCLCLCLSPSASPDLLAPPPSESESESESDEEEDSSLDSSMPRGRR
jgi:hypothetical protein